MRSNDGPDSFCRFADYLAALIAAITADDVISILQRYLSSWSAERVRRLQTVDAGWAPFDERQNPLPPFCARDVRQIREALHAHCEALRSAGIEPLPELLELDLVFVIACLAFERIETREFALGAWPAVCAAPLPRVVARP